MRREAGHHVFGKGAHRAAPQIGVVPVVAGGDQCAEMADFVAERDQLVEHRVRAAGDHHGVQRIVDLRLDFGLGVVVGGAGFAAHFGEGE